jgi:acetyl esterase/lipase
MSSLLSAFSAVAADPIGDELTPGEQAVRKQFSPDAARLTTIRLWPGDVPDEPRPLGEETVTTGQRHGGLRIGVVTQPSVTIVQPRSFASVTPAVLVCPGGGYGSLGVDSGGTDVMAWLNQQGITGVYMKYRVPKRGRDFPMHHQPLQDIQRAVSMIRWRAAELEIDPERIGVIGFSAGGNLAAMLATHHRTQDRLYKEIDDADRMSCRPDFVILLAPAYLTMPIFSHTLDPQLQLDQAARNLTPPVFITSASTDKFTIGASLFALALREKHVPVEVHFYERGGHAEGIHAGPDNQWPRMCEDWMQRRGLIPPDRGREQSSGRAADEVK